MKYRNDRYGKQISQLGYGCMRFTKNGNSIDKTFEEELKRLRTDYIDYYLMHMFTDYVEWEKLQSLGIEEWISRHKEEGSIRNIGFSYHGDMDMFLRILGTVNN